MKWILLVLVFRSGFSAEFNTPEACAKAAKEVEARSVSFIGPTAVTLCVPKGGGTPKTRLPINT